MSSSFASSFPVPVVYGLPEHRASVRAWFSNPIGNLVRLTRPMKEIPGIDHRAVLICTLGLVVEVAKGAKGVIVTPLADFEAAGFTTYDEPVDATPEIADRLRATFESWTYHWLSRNCQYFANWILRGIWVCEQLNAFFAWLNRTAQAFVDALAAQAAKKAFEEAHIFIGSYTRNDGTKVNGYWRRRRLAA